MRRNALKLAAADNVATLMERADVNDSVEIFDEKGEKIETVTAISSIPQGHKIALCSMKPETRVMKYGLPIGVTTQPVQKGEHVHTQNLASTRGRGDL